MLSGPNDPLGDALPPRASHRLPALQLKQKACMLPRSSEPPWFLGTMGSASRAAGAGFAKQQPAPQHSQQPRAWVSTRCFTEPLIGVRWRLLCPKPQASA